MIEPTARGGWRELEARLRPFIAGRVRSAADVDDVVQDVFLRMQRGLQSLRDDNRFGPWVYQVARSAIADRHRDAARHPHAEDNVRDGSQTVNDDQQERADERELLTCIAPFIAELASPYREALTLVELQGLTHKEAAAMLEISVSGMKSRVQRGRAQLRASFEACCHIALDVRGGVVSCEPRSDGRSSGCSGC